MNYSLSSAKTAHLSSSYWCWILPYCKNSGIIRYKVHP